MHLAHLSLRDFRNLQAAEIEPHPRFNVFCGENGQGKTNLLEAIYWLATLRPLRARRLRELVRWGAAGARVEAKVHAEGLDHALAVAAVDGGRREAYREGKAAKSAEYFGALNVVDFTPDDVGLVRAAPADRRQYLDRACFNERAGHLADAVAYRRALDARNTLLRERPDPLLLEVYEAPLAAAGARIIASRLAWLAALQARFVAAFSAISGPELPVELRYRATWEGGPEVAASAEGEPPSAEGAGAEIDPALDAEAVRALELRLVALWAEDRVRDRQRGFTQRGPHADDLVLRLAARPARLYASQGQQRALVLALKIAEIEQLVAHRGVHPVLLLDDVSSELDPRRTARLFDFLDAFEGQVFITTTDEAFLRLGTDRRTWGIAAGDVRSIRG
jgi:DNA replication and repair protein RecF